MKTSIIQPWFASFAVRLFAISFFLWFASITGHGSETSQPAPVDPSSDESGFATYKNEDYGFQVSHPKDWRTATSVSGALWKIAKSATNETGSISISVARYTGDDDAFLQKMLGQDDTMLQQMRQRFPDGRILDKGKTFLGSFPAVYFKSSYSLKNLGTDIPITMIQIMCVRSNLLYLIRYFEILYPILFAKNGELVFPPAAEKFSD